MKDRRRRKDAGEKRVAAIERNADLTTGLGVCAVRDDEKWTVAALAADVRSADGARGGVERHAFGQRRITAAVADAERVGRRAAVRCQRAARVRGALHAGRTRARRERQRPARATAGGRATGGTAGGRAAAGG